jgi:hypothetical protein
VIEEGARALYDARVAQWKKGGKRGPKPSKDDALDDVLEGIDITKEQFKGLKKGKRITRTVEYVFDYEVIGGPSGSPLPPEETAEKPAGAGGEFLPNATARMDDPLDYPPCPCGEQGGSGGTDPDLPGGGERRSAGGSGTVGTPGSRGARRDLGQQVAGGPAPQPQIDTVATESFAPGNSHNAGPAGPLDLGGRPIGETQVGGFEPGGSGSPYGAVGEPELLGQDALAAGVMGITVSAARNRATRAAR